MRRKGCHVNLCRYLMSFPTTILVYSSYSILYEFSSSVESNWFENWFGAGNKIENWKLNNILLISNSPRQFALEVDFSRQKASNARNLFPLVHVRILRGVGFKSNCNYTSNCRHNWQQIFFPSTLRQNVA